jgi:hypothetical protein
VAFNRPCAPWSLERTSNDATEEYFAGGNTDSFPCTAGRQTRSGARPDNDLILDLESVVVDGQRYAIRTDPNRIESEPDRSIVGAIVGAVSGGEIRGRAVNVPRDTVVTFRLERPMEMGVADRGVTRERPSLSRLVRPAALGAIRLETLPGPSVSLRQEMCILR